LLGLAALVVEEVDVAVDAGVRAFLAILGGSGVGKAEGRGPDVSPADLS
jgi:hypothetical protein